MGVIWGSGIGGLETFETEVLGWAKSEGIPRFNPFFIPKMIADITPGHVSMEYGFMDLITLQFLRVHLLQTR